ncbi:TAXI family TRAP transporter solute-binding subunit [Thiohalophilus sp.]|uniref:TAXI family TRAP transporter solute-binding subunit n=1 Tax=Thiohalophilus sp. TaxID=3028392 RepID=UPI002ACDD17C|nr:TAXI family TRAP transporter solute-binding subunit [Thiohalophilus sp.]MDZ7805253.1 TAXI family TRAP transporter solute-binding subunit [Thiohalophilus sp.]
MRLIHAPGFFVGLVLILLGQLALSLAAQAQPLRVTLGTATPGGGFQLFGQHLIEVINTHSTTIQLEEQSTRGSRQNLTLLEKGTLDLGQVEGNAARVALEGLGREKANLKVLSVMYPNPGMFVVRADSPYQRIADLEGRPIAFGTRASGLRILAADVLDGLGLSPEQDFEPIILDRAADGPVLVLEQNAAALWGAGIGWPGFVKVADSPVGARFIAPDAEQIARIRQQHPHLAPMSVPANTYRGQNEAIDSVGLWSLILIRPDLDEETVYQLARALHQSESALAGQLAQARYTTTKNTVEQVPPQRLHTGAARYYREIGLLP